jgi:hypothetical protein
VQVQPIWKQAWPELDTDAALELVFFVSSFLNENLRKSEI